MIHLFWTIEMVKTLQEKEIKLSTKKTPLLKWRCLKQLNCFLQQINRFNNFV
jgi:hypothetical protein